MKQRLLVAALALCLVVPLALAERPPQARKSAKLVVEGAVGKITPTESKFGANGVKTSYAAEVTVDRVERGEGAKPGDTIRVHWFRVTKRPTPPLLGAYGHSYPIRAKDNARFWLMKGPGKDWTVIYNSNGVEKLKK